MGLSEANLSQVLGEIRVVCTKWPKIAHVLKVPFVHTHKNMSLLPEAALQGVILLWLRMATPKPTWSALVKALRNPIVGETELANRLESKYCPRPQQTLSESQPIWQLIPTLESILGTAAPVTSQQGNRHIAKDNRANITCVCNSEMLSLF